MWEINGRPENRGVDLDRSFAGRVHVMPFVFFFAFFLILLFYCFVMEGWVGPVVFISQLSGSHLVKTREVNV